MHSLLPKKPPEKYSAPKRTKTEVRIQDDMRGLVKAKKERIRFIDSTLSTDKSISAAVITNAHNVTRHTAYSDLRRYKELNPNSLEYFHKDQVWKITATFTPLYKEDSNDD